MELLFYVGTLKRLLVIPDWWAVYETNYVGAANLWGRSVGAVRKNMKYWKTKYVIMYQNNPELDSKWAKDFDMISSFFWADYEKELKGTKPYTNDTPYWWLLKVK